MKALVYRGQGNRAWEEHDDPVILDPDDAIVRVLGHEAVGTVEGVAPAVRNVKVGDREGRFAYGVFSRPVETGALKVGLFRS